jgi:hypothetical protein
MRVPGWAPPRLGRRRSLAEEVLKLSAAGTLLMIVPARNDEVDTVVFAYGCVLWLSALCAWFAGAARDRYAWKRFKTDGDDALRLTPSLSRTKWRPVVLALLAITLVTAIRYDECPHGRYIAFGPVWFENNTDPRGPCGNSRHFRPLILHLLRVVD